MPSLTSELQLSMKNRYVVGPYPFVQPDPTSRPFLFTFSDFCQCRSENSSSFEGVAHLLLGHPLYFASRGLWGLSPVRFLETKRVGSEVQPTSLHFLVNKRPEVS